MQINQHKLFPTLVMEVRDFLTDEECQDIFKYVMAKANGTEQHGLITGDGSSCYKPKLKFLDELELNVPSCKGLSQRIFDTVLGYCYESGFTAPEGLYNSWYNLQNEGSGLVRHTHALSVVTGALYINTDINSAPLNFYNPNPFLSFTSIDEYKEATYEWFRFDAVQGTLLLFPSWLSHGSNGAENKTDNRMVISFNSL